MLPSTKSDSDMQRQVIDELKRGTRIKATEVGVEVDRGTVTLTGTVDSYAKKLAAQKAAHLVRGVLDVANDILVRLPGTPGVTDTDVAHAVRSAIECRTLVPSELIQSTVSNGWVTLTGAVDYYSQRYDAERAIQNLAGVNGVTNAITVKPTPVRPENPKRRIENHLTVDPTH